MKKFLAFVGKQDYFLLRLVEQSHLNVITLVLGKENVGMLVIWIVIKTNVLLANIK